MLAEKTHSSTKKTTRGTSVSLDCGTEAVKRKISYRKMSITEAAAASGITRQAIYIAIKQQKIVAVRVRGRLALGPREVALLRDKKYSRDISMVDGERVFDKRKGRFSVRQAAIMLGVDQQKLYYAMRAKQIPSERKGHAWVLCADDIKAYKKLYLRRNRTAVRPASEAKSA